MVIITEAAIQASNLFLLVMINLNSEMKTFPFPIHKIRMPTKMKEWINLFAKISNGVIKDSSFQ
jgi:hypothetical protein